MSASLNDSAQVESRIRELIVNGSATAEDYVQLADVLYRGGRFSEVLATLTDAEASQMRPIEHALVLSEHAQYHLAITGRQDEAVSLAEKALTFVEDQPDTVQSLHIYATAAKLIVDALWSDNRPRSLQIASDALIRISSLIRTSHSTSDFYSASFILGIGSEMYLLLGEPEQAEEWARVALRKAIDVDEQLFAGIRLGKLLRARGALGEAKQVLTNAKTIESQARVTNQQRKALYAELAQVFSDLGDLPEVALLHAEELSWCPPNDSDRWRVELSLARIEMELKQFNDARFHLEHLAASAPEIALREAAAADLRQLNYTVAFSNYEAGDYVKARNQLEVLLAEAGDDLPMRADVLLLLGHVHAEAGNHRDARKCYLQLTDTASSEYCKNAARMSLEKLKQR